MSDSNTLSHSVLDALDGVAASKGRILFAATNYLGRLDSALSRWEGPSGPRPLSERSER